jgi:AraC family transcriptional regulator
MMPLHFLGGDRPSAADINQYGEIVLEGPHGWQTRPRSDQRAYPLDHVRLRRVLDYISAHVADEITLEELAQVACLSTFHFARVFTLAIGVPPHRYVSRMRLENAMAEIAAGRLSLAEVALNAHFSSHASFTRAFRRATGMTPAEYRRCLR